MNTRTSKHYLRNEVFRSEYSCILPPARKIVLCSISLLFILYYCCCCCCVFLWLRSFGFIENHLKWKWCGFHVMAHLFQYNNMHMTKICVAHILRHIADAWAIAYWSSLLNVHSLSCQWCPISLHVVSV